MVALGSNIDTGFKSSEALLDAALDRFAVQGLNIVKRSRWWRSAAWPDPDAPDYINGLAIVETRLTPIETLEALLAIEVQFGRHRTVANAPRTLDLDLIAYGRVVIDSDAITLPHPRAHQRLFVMGPLAEIAPGWRHPLLGQTAAALAAKARVGRDARMI